MVVVRTKGPGAFYRLGPGKELDEDVVLQRFLKGPGRLFRNPFTAFRHLQELFLSLGIGLEVFGNDARQAGVAFRVADGGLQHDLHPFPVVELLGNAGHVLGGDTVMVRFVHFIDLFVHLFQEVPEGPLSGHDVLEILARVPTLGGRDAPADGSGHDFETVFEVLMGHEAVLVRTAGPEVAQLCDFFLVLLYGDPGRPSGR